MSIDEVFVKFGHLNVLVIGDLMIDAYIWGKVERISPEAPVPIVQTIKSEIRLGGAANVAKNLVALGAKVSIAGVIGNDKEGFDMLNLLENEHINHDLVIKDSTRPTTVKERILAHSQQLLRIDKESDALISEEISEEIFQKIDALIHDFDVIIFEDYDKGVLSESLIQQIIQLAQKENIPTVIDPKKRNFKAFSGCTLFKPNLKELREGFNTQSPFATKNFVADLFANRKALNTEILMVTLSENGVVLVDKNETFVHIKAHKREISDVSGAGDTVVAIASLCIALKLPLKMIGELSNLGGGLVCEFLGVVPISKENLKHEAKLKIADYK